MFPLQLIFLALAHFLGDFVFQTEYMALNKSSKTRALALHINVYFWCILVVMSCCPGVTTGGALAFATWNAVAHAVTDYRTSREMKHHREQNNQRKFFLWLGLDQMIHMMCFYLSLYLLMEE